MGLLGKDDIAKVKINNNMVPTNQTYRKAVTFAKYPHIEKIYREYVNWCINEVKWNKHGRAYDCAMALSNIEFKDKKVCELGARDSIFSSYLTKEVEKVYVSDIFEGWGDLGSLEQWKNLWEKFAFDKNKLVCERQDMTKLSYPDKFFDIVVSFSAIEHIYNGDFMAAKEMGRVCKDKGYIVIGTEINSNNKTVWHSGSYFYSEDDLFKKIIENTGAKLCGSYDFSYENSDKDEKFAGLNFSSCIFILKK